MADISKEIRDFREAIYGEEVRGSMISLAEKINKESGDAVEAAEGYRDSAKTYASTASALCEATTKSADQASEKATEALASAAAAKESENNAESYAESARESEIAAKLYEASAKKSEAYVAENIHTVEEKAAEASASAEAAAGSESVASAKAGEASDSAAAAKESENKAEEFANRSKSYAVGTGDEFRAGDSTDNSLFYKNEAQKLLKQATTLLESVSSGGLIPAGTVAFEDLPTSAQTGYMYNISNAFVTDDRFSDGTGLHYNAGANVYWTADGKWDVLTGVQVTGVKGSAESVYRTGEVNITKGNIGLENVENKSSADIRGELTKENITGALGYTPPTTNTTYGTANQSTAGLMSSEDKKKLDGVSENANNYTHPTTAGNHHIPTGGAAGQFLKWLRDGVAEWASLGAAAFASLANNLATTEPGFAMDARVGPVIDKKFTDMETQLEELNSALGIVSGNYVYTAASSTTSFSDAFGKVNSVSGNMALALDAMDASASSYENGVHSVAGGTQTYFILLCKRTNNTYAGIIMTYLGYNPVFFSRSTGGFRLFLPITVT